MSGKKAAPIKRWESVRQIVFILVTGQEQNSRFVSKMSYITSCVNFSHQNQQFAVQCWWWWWTRHQFGFLVIYPLQLVTKVFEDVNLIVAALRHGPLLSPELTVQCQMLCDHCHAPLLLHFSRLPGKTWWSGIHTPGSVDLHQDYSIMLQHLLLKVAIGDHHHILKVSILATSITTTPPAISAKWNVCLKYMWAGGSK